MFKRASVWGQEPKFLILFLCLEEPLLQEAQATDLAAAAAKVILPVSSIYSNCAERDGGHYFIFKSLVQNVWL